MTAVHHPEQVQVWVVLDRVQVRKAWAIDLLVCESEVSRWASGTRAMSIDDLVAAARVARRSGRADVAERLGAMMVALLSGDCPEERVVDPMATGFSSAELAGDACRVLRSALADGRIDAAEAKEIDRLATRHEEIARDLHDVAATARRGSR